MNLLRAYLVLGWLLLMAISAWAISTQGLDGGQVFIHDFSHAWRAQFNTDFLLHVVPISAWAYWRERSRAVGVLCAAGVWMGGVFTLAYVLAASFRSGGDLRRLLLGRHADPV